MIAAGSAPGSGIPPERNRPRIGWNLLAVRREALGGWLYTKSLLEAVERHARGTRITAFVTAESRALVENLSGVDVVDVKVDSRVRILRILAEHTQLPALSQRHDIHCLHHFAGTAPQVRSVACALTVHDLLVFHRPETFSLPKRIYLRHAVPSSIRRAHLIFPLSETTAVDIRKHFPDASGKLTVIHPVVDDSWYPPTLSECADLRAQLGLPPHFWLYVANGYAHKNHEALLVAIAHMRNDGIEPWPLILRGSHLDPYLSRAVEMGLGDIVRVIPPVAQQNMRALYGAASASVFPSYFEGAGLPALEAMACAVPLIASDIPTNREFLGDYAERIDPQNARLLADAMVRMQQCPPDRETLAKASARLLQGQRPQAIAHRLLAGYDAAIARAAIPA